MLYTCLYASILGALALLWGLAYSTGQIDNLQSFLGDVGLKNYRFYGDQMQGFLPPYLEMSMESFAKAQEQMRENMSRTFGASTPMAAFEEQAQRNMALFQQAMKVWAPFAAGGGIPGIPGMTPAKAGATDDEDKDEQLAELRRQMEQMQKQLDQMAKR